MIDFFRTTLFIPIYNLLIGFVHVLPNGDLGLAVVCVTLVVKTVTAPLSISALKTQRAMKLLEPQLKALREKYKNDKEQQAKELFALYRENGVRPFASLFSVLIQIPVLISLFFVFQSEARSGINPDLLYSFVAMPEVVSPLFLGLISVAGSSILLAVLAAGAQFLQAFYAIPVPKAVKDGSMQDEFARAISIQARYVLPLIMGVVAYASGAIALYFITSSLFAIAQEFYIRTKYPDIRKA
jgi:YidC/Oxa1 family membrane protein insertase